MFAQIPLGLRSVSGDRLFLSSWCKEGILHTEFYLPSSGRDGEVGAPFLPSLFLQCLQLKIILMPKQRVWGWHMLPPFASSLDKTKLWIASLTPTGIHSQLPPFFPAFSMFQTPSFGGSWWIYTGSSLCFLLSFFKNSKLDLHDIFRSLYIFFKHSWSIYKC